MADIYQGYITIYDPLKGIGFIRREKGKDVFLHYTNLSCSEESIIPGAIVNFSIEKTPKGPRAKNVHVIGNLE